MKLNYRRIGTKNAAVHALKAGHFRTPLCRKVSTENHSAHYISTEDDVTCRNCLRILADTGVKTLASGEYAHPVKIWDAGRNYDGDCLWLIHTSETEMVIVELREGAEITEQTISTYDWRIAALAFRTGDDTWTIEAVEDDGTCLRTPGFQTSQAAAWGMHDMLLTLRPARTERRKLPALEIAWEDIRLEASTGRVEYACYSSAWENADQTMRETGVWTQDGGKQARTSAWYECALSSYESLMDGDTYAHLNREA